MRKVLRSALAVTITWLAFASSAQAWVIEKKECWVTGGGWIELPTGGKATFGFNAVAPHGDLISGHITVVNHDTQTGFFCKLDTLNCECSPTGGTAVFSGTLTQLGPGGGPVGSCTVAVVDNGEPGSGPQAPGPDAIAFDVFTGVPTGITFDLGGGNVQIHGCRGPGAGR
jgi:hypothetical protein